MARKSAIDAETNDIAAFLKKAQAILALIVASSRILPREALKSGATAPKSLDLVQLEETLKAIAGECRKAMEPLKAMREGREREEQLHAEIARLNAIIAGKGTEEKAAPKGKKQPPQEQAAAA